VKPLLHCLRVAPPAGVRRVVAHSLPDRQRQLARQPVLLTGAHRVELVGLRGALDLRR
jgi:hypothetical protein